MSKETSIKEEFNEIFHCTDEVKEKSLQYD